MQGEPPAQVLDPLGALGRGAAHEPVDLVALLEQELGEVGAVLPGDAGDQRGRRHGSGRRPLAAHPVDRARRSPARRRYGPPSRARGAPSRPTGHGAGRRPGSSAGAPARRRPGPRRTAPRRSVAICSTVSSSAAEMLKSSFSAAGERIAADDAVRDVVDVRERARLARPSRRSAGGRWPARTLRIRSGTTCAMPGLVGRSLARAVRVERAADREGQAVLLVRRAALDLAGQLREAVGRDAAAGSPADGPLASGTRCRARTPSSSRCRRSARPRPPSAAPMTPL